MVPPQVQSLSFICTERRIKQDNAIASIIVDLPPWMNWLTFDNAVTAEGLRYVVLLLQQGWRGHQRRSSPAFATTPRADPGDDTTNADVTTFAFAGVTGLAVRNHAFKLDELQPVVDLLQPPAARYVASGGGSQGV